MSLTTISEMSDQRTQIGLAENIIM